MIEIGIGIEIEIGIGIGIEIEIEIGIGVRGMAKPPFILPGRTRVSAPAPVPVTPKTMKPTANRDAARNMETYAVSTTSWVFSPTDVCRYSSDILDVSFLNSSFISRLSKVRRSGTWSADRESKNWSAFRMTSMRA